jgi:hypothetical protein
MAQTLEGFIEEATYLIVAFEKFWREQNAKNPEEYPMQMRDGDDGSWWEFMLGMNCLSAPPFKNRDVSNIETVFDK